MAIINGTNAADTLTTTSGDDVVRAYGGNDRIYASDGNDDIDGGTSSIGGDALIFALGDTTLFSGARQFRRLTLTSAQAFDDVGLIQTRFAGIERIEVRNRGTGSTDLIVDAAQLSLPAASARYVLSFYGSTRDETVYGSQFDDFITVGLGINSIDAGGGHDVVELSFDHTRAGPMVFSEIDGALVSDQDGVRTNVVRDAEEVQIAYDLEMTPTRGQDIDARAVTRHLSFIGSSLADTVVGGMGADTFYGFGVGDIVTMGGGADIFTVPYAVGEIGGTITDLGYEDTLRFTSFNASNQYPAVYIGEAEFGGRVNEVRFVAGSGISYIEVDGDGDGRADAIITLANGASDLAAVNDFPYGLGELYSRLHVVGTDSADMLSGTERSDRIDGGAGDDTITIFGDDIVTGGAGRDTFVATGGRPTITDLTTDDRLIFNFAMPGYLPLVTRHGEYVDSPQFGYTSHILIPGSTQFDFATRQVDGQLILTPYLRDYRVIDTGVDNASDFVVAEAAGRRYVAVGGDVVVVDTATDAVLARWTLPYQIRLLALSDDGAQLLAAPLGTTVYQLDTATGSTVRTFTVPYGTLDLQFTSSTQAFATSNNVLVALDVTTGAVSTRSDLQLPATTMARDENLLLIASTFSQLSVYDTATNVVRATNNNDAPFGDFQGRSGAQAISADADLVAIGYRNGLRLLDLDLNDRASFTLTHGAQGIVFAPDGKSMFVLTADFMPVILQYDLATLNVVHEFQIDGTIDYSLERGATRMVFDEDGRHLTILDYDRSIQVIDLTVRSETLAGTVGADTLSGFGGDDVLIGAGGNDTVDGGTGTDTLVLAGRHDGYTLLTDAGFTYLVGAEGAVKFVNVEILRFTDGEMTVDTAAATLAPFDAVRYLASNGDLIASGVDTAVAQAHFVASGFAEGRLAQSFNPTAYLETYGDLRAVYGNDLTAAEQHYVAFGYDEGRTINFDAIAYLAANADLIDAFGTDTAAATRHYFDLGIGEGRGITFDYVGYLAANGDLAALVGLDAKAAALDYIVTGRAAGVDPGDFDGLRYIASQPDLITVFGNDAHAGALHYVLFGRDEHRDPLAFDPLLYGATNVDLALAFGTDAALLTNHYVVAGYAENRVTSGFDAVAYLLSNPDLAAAHLGVDGALQHWLAFGAAEGRSGDDAFGREQTSHSLLSYAQSTLLETPSDRDWFEVDLTAGKQMTVAFNGNFDPRLSIYDHDGNLIATDGRASSVFYSSETLTFTPEETGTYYVVVGADRAVYDYLNYSTSIYG